jgi:hypothetical protein
VTSFEAGKTPPIAICGAKFVLAPQIILSAIWVALVLVTIAVGCGAIQNLAPQTA